MSFDQFEKSDYLGTPIEIYDFTYGPGEGDILRYTNFSRDYTLDNKVYTAIPISREAYKSSGKVDKTSLTIKVPENVELGAMFTDYPPTQPVTVIARTAHLLDGTTPQFLVFWSGRMLSVAKEGNETAFTCDSTILSLKRPGLKRNYQYGCPLVLYSNRCAANRAAAQRDSKVVSITNGVVGLLGGWNQGTPYAQFTNGMISWKGAHGTEFRTIRNVSADGAIQFIGPPRDLVVDTPVSLFLGCNHLVDDCHNVHHNINNYGGHPWIPTKNPTKYHPFW